MPATKFVHLHVHTENSMLDGLALPKEYVQQCVEHGLPALAMTDHGNIFGAPEFYKLCRKAGIEPIIGCEFYYVLNAAECREDKDQDRFHITVLARGFEGYKVLARVITKSNEQFYGKPLVDRALLESLGDDAQHLTVLSGCAGSRLSRLLLEEDDSGAREELMWWRETFDHYYIELMHHGTDFDEHLNEALIAVARDYSLPLVITNDPHYAVPEDAPHHDALLAIQTGSDIDDPNRFKFDGSGYWLKSRAEVRKVMRRYGDDVWKEGAANTLKIAKDCYLRIPAWESKTWKIPKFPGVDDPQAEVEKRTRRFLKRKGLWSNPKYRREAKHEFKVIEETGIADFMLITAESLDWARAQPPNEDGLRIRVGPGRGSVAGSMVGWALNIHKVDPVKYKLRQDRFLNPARPKMPDIDSDLSRARREEVIRHCIELYGEENTMAVAAFGRMQVKAAFNSLSKAYGINYLDAQRLNKEIIVDEGDEDDDTEVKHYILPEELTEQFPELSAQVDRLVGVKKNVAKHPAGLIIADPSENLHDQIPLAFIASSGKWVGSFDKKAVESMGYMKQDFLGLRTLDTIEECINLIERRTGERIEPDDWVPDEEDRDDEVYAMLAEGRTAGVFQMEGPTNQRGCRDVKPSCFEDIVSITSLYRTGAISAGFPKIFNKNRKRGTEYIEYAHPALKPILEETWGVVLYQEQVMSFGSDLAGFDMGQVDDIKEAIKDKSSEAMQAMKKPFIVGCKKHSGIPKDAALQIWKMIEGYAGYGYNRSHAVAYSLVTYQTARLKLLYPLEWIAALLRTVKSDKKNDVKRDVYLREAVEFGAKILPPDINESELGATPTLDGTAIRFGLTDLSGIAYKTGSKITRNRPEGGFSSLAEVEAAVGNKGTMRALTEGSALESLGVPGDPQLTEQRLKWVFRDTMAKYRSKYAGRVHLPSDGGDENVTLIGELFSVTKGTTKAGNKPFVTWKLRWSVTEAFDVRLWSETEKFWDLQEGSIVQVQGKWEPKWLNVSCGNPRMIKVLKAVR